MNPLPFTISHASFVNYSQALASQQDTLVSSLPSQGFLHRLQPFLDEYALLKPSLNHIYPPLFSVVELKKQLANPVQLQLEISNKFLTFFKGILSKLEENTARLELFYQEPLWQGRLSTEAFTLGQLLQDLLTEIRALKADPSRSYIYLEGSYLDQADPTYQQRACNTLGQALGINLEVPLATKHEQIDIDFSVKLQNFSDEQFLNLINRLANRLVQRFCKKSPYEDLYGLFFNKYFKIDPQWRDETYYATLSFTTSTNFKVDITLLQTSPCSYLTEADSACVPLDPLLDSDQCQALNLETKSRLPIWQHIIDKNGKLTRLNPAIINEQKAWFRALVNKSKGSTFIQDRTFALMIDKLKIRFEKEKDPFNTYLKVIDSHLNQVPERFFNCCYQFFQAHTALGLLTAEQLKRAGVTFAQETPPSSLFSTDIYIDIQSLFREESLSFEFIDALFNTIVSLRQAPQLIYYSKDVYQLEVGTTFLQFNRSQAQAFQALFKSSKAFKLSSTASQTIKELLTKLLTVDFSQVSSEFENLKEALFQTSSEPFLKTLLFLASLRVKNFSYSEFLPRFIELFKAAFCYFDSLVERQQIFIQANELLDPKLKSYFNLEWLINIETLPSFTPEEIDLFLILTLAEKHSDIEVSLSAQLLAKMTKDETRICANTLALKLKPLYCLRLWQVVLQKRALEGQEAFQQLMKANSKVLSKQELQLLASCLEQVLDIPDNPKRGKQKRANLQSIKLSFTEEQFLISLCQQLIDQGYTLKALSLMQKAIDHSCFHALKAEKLVIAAAEQLVKNNRLESAWTLFKTSAHLFPTKDENLISRRKGLLHTLFRQRENFNCHLLDLLEEYFTFIGAADHPEVNAIDLYLSHLCSTRNLDKILHTFVNFRPFLPLEHAPSFLKQLSLEFSPDDPQATSLYNLIAKDHLFCDFSYLKAFDKAHSLFERQVPYPFEILVNLFTQETLKQWDKDSIQAYPWALKLFECLYTLKDKRSITSLNQLCATVLQQLPLLKQESSSIQTMVFSHFHAHFKTIYVLVHIDLAGCLQAMFQLKGQHFLKLNLTHKFIAQFSDLNLDGRLQQNILDTIKQALAEEILTSEQCETIECALKHLQQRINLEALAPAIQGWITYLVALKKVNSLDKAYQWLINVKPALQADNWQALCESVYCQAANSHPLLAVDVGVDHLSDSISSPRLQALTVSLIQHLLKTKTQLAKSLTLLENLNLTLHSPLLIAYWKSVKDHEESVLLRVVRLLDRIDTTQLSQEQLIALLDLCTVGVDKWQHPALLEELVVNLSLICQLSAKVKSPQPVLKIGCWLFRKLTDHYVSRLDRKKLELFYQQTQMVDESLGKLSSYPFAIDTFFDVALDLLKLHAVTPIEMGPLIKSIKQILFYWFKSGHDEPDLEEFLIYYLKHLAYASQDNLTSSQLTEFAELSMTVIQYFKTAHLKEFFSILGQTFNSAHFWQQFFLKFNQLLKNPQFKCLAEPDRSYSSSFFKEVFKRYIDCSLATEIDLQKSSLLLEKDAYELQAYAFEDILKQKFNAPKFDFAHLVSNYLLTLRQFNAKRFEESLQTIWHYFSLTLTQVPVDKASQQEREAFYDELITHFYTQALELVYLLSFKSFPLSNYVEDRGKIIEGARHFLKSFLLVNNIDHTSDSKKLDAQYLPFECQFVLPLKEMENTKEHPLRSFYHLHRSINNESLNNQSADNLPLTYDHPEEAKGLLKALAPLFTQLLQLYPQDLKVTAFIHYFIQRHFSLLVDLHPASSQELSQMFFQLVSSFSATRSDYLTIHLKTMKLLYWRLSLLPTFFNEQYEAVFKTNLYLHGKHTPFKLKASERAKWIITTVKQTLISSKESFNPCVLNFFSRGVLPLIEDEKLAAQCYAHLFQAMQKHHAQCVHYIFEDYNVGVRVPQTVFFYEFVEHILLQDALKSPQFVISQLPTYIAFLIPIFDQCLLSNYLEKFTVFLIKFLKKSFQNETLKNSPQALLQMFHSGFSHCANATQKFENFSTHTVCFNLLEKLILDALKASILPEHTDWCLDAVEVLIALSRLRFENFFELLKSSPDQNLVICIQTPVLCQIMAEFVGLTPDQWHRRAQLANQWLRMFDSFKQKEKDFEISKINLNTLFFFMNTGIYTRQEALLVEIQNELFSD